MNYSKCQDIPNLHDACYDLDMDKVIASLSTGESVDIYRSSNRREFSEAGFLKHHFTTEYANICISNFYTFSLFVVGKPLKLFVCAWRIWI